jgi:hypothetical protein
MFSRGQELARRLEKLRIRRLKEIRALSLDRATGPVEEDIHKLADSSKAPNLEPPLSVLHRFRMIRKASLLEFQQNSRVD